MIINRKPGETLEQYLDRVKSMAPTIGQPPPPDGWYELVKEVELEEKKKKDMQEDGDS